MQEKVLSQIVSNFMRHISSTSTYIHLIQTVGLLTAFLLLIINISEQSYWLDEIFSVINSTDFNSFYFALEQSGGNRIFYYLLLWPWIRLFGDHEFVTRLHTVLTCMLAVCLLYSFTAKFFGKKVGLISAGLLTINPFFLAYGKITRNYGLLLLLSVASVFSFLLLMRRKEFKFFILLATVNGLMVLTHPVAVPFILSQAVGVFLFWEWRKVPWIKLSLTFALPALIYLILPVVFGSPDSGQAEWLQPPDMTMVIYTLIEVFGGAFAMLFFAIVVFIVLLVKMISTAPFRYKDETFRVVLFLVVLFWLPILLLVAVSHFIQPAFWDRYLIVVFPVFIVLAGYVLSEIKIAVLTVALMILPIMTLLSADFDQLTYTEDWRGVVELIYDEYQEGDTVGFFVYYGQRPFRYYLNREAAESQQSNTVQKTLALTEFADGAYFLNGGSRQPDHSQDAIRSLGTTYQRVWFVVYAKRIFEDETLAQEAAIHNDLNQYFGPVMDKYDFEQIEVYLYHVEK
ncbi:MAG: glycosyltransferase family 39 protein [Chloroflexota bacterium]